MSDCVHLQLTYNIPTGDDVHGMYLIAASYAVLVMKVTTHGLSHECQILVAFFLLRIFPPYRCCSGICIEYA